MALPSSGPCVAGPEPGCADADADRPAGRATRCSASRGGADDYLAKPFGMRELVARVRALLRRPRRSHRRVARPHELAPVRRHSRLDRDRSGAAPGAREGDEVDLSRAGVPAAAPVGLAPRHRVQPRGAALARVARSQFVTLRVARHPGEAPASAHRAGARGPVTHPDDLGQRPWLKGCRGPD